MIYLSSANAFKNLGVSEHLFFFDDTIHCAPNIGMTLSLTSLQFCNSQYTVNDNNNKIDLRFSAGGAYSSTMITVPSGFYSQSSFAAEVQSLMNAAFVQNHIVITFNFKTGKFSLRAADNETHFLGIYREGTTCFDPLGFPRSTSVVPAVDGLLIMPQPCDFSGLNSIYFEMLNIPVNALDSRTGGRSSVLARVNVDAETGQFVYYTDESNTRLRLNLKTLNVFHCRLSDRHGAPIDFNGIGWECSLLVSFHYLVSPRAYPLLDNVVGSQARADDDNATDA